MLNNYLCVFLFRATRAYCLFSSCYFLVGLWQENFLNPTIYSKYTTVYSKYTTIYSKYTTIYSKYTTICSKYTNIYSKYTNIYSKYTNIYSKYTTISQNIQLYLKIYNYILKIYNYILKILVKCVYFICFLLDCNSISILALFSFTSLFGTENVYIEFNMSVYHVYIINCHSLCNDYTV